MKKHFENKKFVMASELSGYGLKEILKKYYSGKGYEIIDVGTTDPENPVSYYDAGAKAAEAVRDGAAEFGIVICGTGMGVCMAANRIPGIYCSICESIHTAKLARQINNANVLALGANIVAPELAKAMADTFIETDFMEGFPASVHDGLVEAIERLGEIERTAYTKYYA